MTRVPVLLRFDRATWSRFAAQSTAGSAAILAVGAYAVFAWDRFGFQAIVAPRASTRMLLIGLYGWIGLAVAAWAIAKFTRGTVSDLATVVRLYGLAHLPLLLVAITIQATAVLFQLSGPGWVAAGLVLAVWMPGQLVAATRQAFQLDTRDSVAVVILPYALWVLVIGGLLFRQIGHLL